MKRVRNDPALEGTSWPVPDAEFGELAHRVRYDRHRPLTDSERFQIADVMSAYEALVILDQRTRSKRAGAIKRAIAAHPPGGREP